MPPLKKQDALIDGRFAIVYQLIFKKTHIKGEIYTYDDRRH